MERHLNTLQKKKNRMFVSVFFCYSMHDFSFTQLRQSFIFAELAGSVPGLHYVLLSWFLNLDLDSWVLHFPISPFLPFPYNFLLVSSTQWEVKSYPIQSWLNDIPKTVPYHFNIYFVKKLALYIINIQVQCNKIVKL